MTRKKCDINCTCNVVRVGVFSESSIRYWRKTHLSGLMRHGITPIRSLLPCRCFIVHIQIPGDSVLSVGMTGGVVGFGPVWLSK
jgi:hypothetical protein